MINIRNLTKIYKTQIKTGNTLQDLFNRKYKEYKALDNVSFQIDENELIGFIGPNGAGKTTTMKILAGILYPTAGSVNVLGYTPFEKKHSFLKQIAFIMGQKNQLLWELPAWDSFNLNKEIYEIEENSYKKNVHELVELLECEEFVTQPVKTLSLGQRMRVELIAALLHEPKILFLDEPTIGLDIFAQTIIINFIKEYQKRHKATIVLTSHYMQDVERLASRIILIDKGQMIFDNTIASLRTTYGEEKILRITLNKELPPHTQLPHNVRYTYTFPELKIYLKKHNITELLSDILKEVDYTDFTLEDDSIEEVIKKVFKK